ncbi:hypothetical protein SH449x_003329 [Pirellulaceae bacterium SH449]
MRRSYVLFAIAPFVVVGGIWAMAQEPKNTQPARYVPSTSQAFGNNYTDGPQPTQMATPLGQRAFSVPAAVPGVPHVPPPYGNIVFPEVSHIPGAHVPRNELLKLADGKFSITTMEQPGPDDWKEDSDAKQKLNTAVQKLRSSDTEEEAATEARSLLANYLEAQFDHDLSKRETQISDLQKQIDKLKSQLEKRKASKEKMVEMRLTLLENEANGLAFPPAWNSLPVSNTANFSQPPFYSGPAVPQVHVFPPNAGGFGQPMPPQPTGVQIYREPFYPSNGPQKPGPGNEQNSSDRR